MGRLREFENGRETQMETNGQVELLALWGLSSAYGELTKAIVSL